MESLGINPVLLLAQLVSFGILFYVLNKFLYSKIRKSLEDRREAIRQINVKNEQLDKKITDLEAKGKEMSLKNKKELDLLLAEAQKNAEELKKEILSQADSRSRKILEDASAEIELQKQEATKQLESSAKKIASQMAMRILESPENSKKVLDKSISELDKLTKNK